MQSYRLTQLLSAARTRRGAATPVTAFIIDFYYLPLFSSFFYPRPSVLWTLLSAESELGRQDAARLITTGKATDG